jgi:hypothetical protein
MTSVARDRWRWQRDTELIDMSETEITTIRTGNRPAPSLERLRELFDFEPDIGLLWKIQRGRARAGDVAGGYHHSGNKRIGIDRASFRLDQIVRLYGAGAIEAETSAHRDIR